MRHRAKGRQLSRTSTHKRAMLNNMATSLLAHGRVVTTEAKAKELRPFAEKLITLARRGDLHARRLVGRKIKDREVLGKLFAEINCREQVFVMTSSLSGYFLAPLARRDRVVIAATETDAETNETTFPNVFARVLAAGLDPAEHDVDKDGRLTLFDLYVVVAKEIAQNYAGAEQLATEHQQLDDDGDGIGHELQNAYLPEEQGGVPPGKKMTRRPHRDGVRAAQIMLSPGK